MIKEQETKLSNIIKLEQKETYKDQKVPDFWKLKQKKKRTKLTIILMSSTLKFAS